MHWKAGIYFQDQFSSCWNVQYLFCNSIPGSVWRSSLKTGKRPRPDQTKTDQDWKFLRPIKTVTAVQSSVHLYFGKWKTGKRLVLAVSTGLLASKPHSRIVGISITNCVLLSRKLIRFWTKRVTHAGKCRAPDRQQSTSINCCLHHLPPAPPLHPPTPNMPEIRS